MSFNTDTYKLSNSLATHLSIYNEDVKKRVTGLIVPIFEFLMDGSDFMNRSEADIEQDVEILLRLRDRESYPEKEFVRSLIMDLIPILAREQFTVTESKMEPIYLSSPAKVSSYASKTLGSPTKSLQANAMFNSIQKSKLQNSVISPARTFTKAEFPSLSQTSSLKLGKPPGLNTWASTVGYDHIDDMEVVEENFNTKNFYDNENKHHFKFTPDSGMVSVENIDAYLNEIGDSVSFYSKGLTGKEVDQFLMDNYPKTEYTVGKKLASDGNNYSVFIGLRGFVKPEDIKNMIDFKIAEKDRCIISTTYSFDDFIDHFAEKYPNYRDEYAVSHYTKKGDDRVTIMTFSKPFIADFKMPTKKELLAKFKKYPGEKVAVAHLNNVPKSIFSRFSEKGTVHGYKIKETSKQPTDPDFKNFIVFASDK